MFRWFESVGLSQAPRSQVCASLQRLGVEYAREAKIADGFFSADVALKIAGFEVALEVDGPSHFLRPGMVPTGPTKMRDRALATKGWPCLSVPYFEWPSSVAKQARGRGVASGCNCCRVKCMFGATYISPH